MWYQVFTLTSAAGGGGERGKVTKLSSFGDSESLGKSNGTKGSQI